MTVMRLFGKEETNTKRQFEFDLAKAICILGMVFVHCFEDFPLTEGALDGSLYYTFVTVLDALFGAGTFMVCLGVGLAYTKNNNPNHFMKRGLVTFLLGYLLNVFRYTVPASYYFLIADPLFAAKYVLACTLITDIMQFAGLAFLLFGFLKKIKVPDWGIGVIALAMSIAGTFLRQFTMDSIWTSEPLGLLVGTQYSFSFFSYTAPFPLLNWFIFPVLGYFLAKLLRRCLNTEVFYAITTSVSGTIMIVYMALAIPNRFGMMSGDMIDYFQMTTPEALIIFVGALFAFGLYHYVSKLFGQKVKSFITGLSANINKTYCIHWVIVAWLGLILWDFVQVELEAYMVVIIALVVYVVSSFLGEVVKKLTDKRKAAKKGTSFRASPEGRDCSFPSLLQRRAKINGEKVAYVFKGKEYTWAEVDVQSSCLASLLRAKGIKKGSHVGVCGPNSINWVLTFFAIEKLGAIAVLINPALKQNEIESVCRIGDVTHLCFDSQGCDLSVESLKESQFEGIVDFSTEINNETSRLDIFDDGYRSDDACVMIYTSGSTGKPKAVLCSAYGLLFSTQTIIDDAIHSIDDVNLGFLPFFHVFGFTSTIVAGLLRGFRSVIPESRSAREMIGLIDKYKVTLFNTVPTMMLAIVASKEFAPEKLTSLRYSLIGGAPIGKEQMKKLMDLLPNNHFAIIYGMSENAAICVTRYHDTVEHITETVGKPINGLSILIKDQTGKHLPDGQVGEVCVKSEGMLVWYYRLPLDMQPVDGDGFLRTGDLGFIDNDGCLRLTGRIKDLIISGGENVSPREVAEALLGLGLFSAVEVMGVPDEVKGELVAAALIMKPGIMFDEDEIRGKASSILAKFQQPAYYIALESFPLLSTGKVDRISLSKMIRK